MFKTVKDLDDAVEKHLKGGNKSMLRDLLNRARTQGGMGESLPTAGVPDDSAVRDRGWLGKLTGRGN
jgi:hypothetical protein